MNITFILFIIYISNSLMLAYHHNNVTAISLILPLQKGSLPDQRPLDRHFLNWLPLSTNP